MGTVMEEQSPHSWCIREYLHIGWESGKRCSDFLKIYPNPIFNSLPIQAFSVAWDPFSQCENFE